MSQLHQLHQLMEMGYQSALADMRVFIEREAKLRRELDRLDRHAALTEVQAPPQGSMRAIGADVIWLRWLEKTRAELNLELARVMAQKHDHLARVKKAFGKSIVTAELSERETKAQRQEREKKQRDRVIAYAALSVVLPRDL